MNRKRNIIKVVMVTVFFFTFHFSPFTLMAQAPGTTPVTVSHETQMMNGRKYYVHIVERGQTVYSISRAYKVENYDAVTHVDIHFLHPGDTVWLPARGQFDEPAADAKPAAPKQQEAPKTVVTEPVQQRPTPNFSGSVTSPYSSERLTERVEESPVNEDPESEERRAEYKDQKRREAEKLAAEEPAVQPSQQVPVVSPTGKVMRVSLMMPLHLDNIDEISTTKFDIEQRGKKSYKQFEFIEFYEGVRMALDEVTSKLGIDVELNVVDVSENTDAAVERAFRTHNIAQSDFVVALLLRDAFNKVSDLAREAGVYVVNPMATRSDITANNPYMVKIQPSMESQVRAMLDNMKLERPNSQLYIIHSGAASEKALLNEVKRQLTERGEIRYILFNWSQNAKLGMAMKKTPNCNVLSIYDNKQDQMRIYVSTLLNRLAAFKTDAPTLYTIGDWTREYPDVDLSQLQQLNYHTFSTAWDMTNNIHVEFLKTFRDTYGTEPNSQLAATAYDLITYIVNGLHEKNVGFWQEPTQPSPEMLFPLHLSRNKAGLENDSPQLFRMEMLRFVPVRKY